MDFVREPDGSASFSPSRSRHARSSEPGIVRHKKKWRARVSYQNRWIHLGLFAERADAEIAAREGRVVISRKNVSSWIGLNPISFARRLGIWRKAKGLTVKAMARKVGMQPGNYSRFESGSREPSLATFVALADALEVHLDDLVHRNIVPAPSYRGCVDLPHFGPRLRDLRARARLTVGQVALRTDLHPKTVEGLESGRRAPSLALAWRLARVLGVTLDSLVQAPGEAPEGHEWPIGPKVENGPVNRIAGVDDSPL